MLFEDFQKKNKPSDAEVKAEYNRVVAQMGAGSGGKEYKSRHILVETEDQAKALIVQINKGAKFADVAKKNSKDPGSGANGGDLGWADPAGFVPEFGNSLKSLKKGQMTQTPVKSQFGYHIILLEDSRDLKRPPPPKLEEVKEQVSQKILQDKSEAWRKNIRDKATIK
ncbi:unnamed protein product [Darwinula stevensoni]|uniref:Peptidyl-prolyl cis-trans isomerase n=1 Tax=Darwinula stevensoni TaxID=69355 RepID=A0A7R9FUC4_9CRUS|nr:unnamed protein product [Darwinula stevensoni]CAG0908114.1 unnamed protein product [Darwinula stevensoni]